jgi:hypothetical protein
VLTGKGNVVTVFAGLNASNTTLFQVQYRINGSTAGSPRQVRFSVLRRFYLNPEHSNRALTWVFLYY